MLVENIRAAGNNAVLLREPGNTRIGEEIRNLLLDSKNKEMCPECELLLYEAARAQLICEVLVPALEAGASVVCDRFTDSTWAYQAIGRGISEEFVDTANRFASANIEPDLTILLYLDDDQKKQRIGSRGSTDRLEQAGVEFHNMVEAAFKRLARMYPNRVVEVSAEGSADEVAGRIWKLVCDRGLIGGFCG